ncbi:MAG: response regulator [Bacteroidota bacterium]
MQHDSEARTIRLYELLLLALAALCLGIGIFSQSVTPAVPDPLGVRIGLAVASLLAAGTLYVAPFLWRFAGPITYSVLTLHSVLHLFFAYTSQLAYAQAVGLVLVAVLTAISLHDLRWMLGYSVVVGGVATAMGFFLPNTSLSPVLLTSAMVTVPIIGGIAVQSRRILEEELLSTIAEAEVAVKAKSEFLATMSHEIRTPMNGVLGMTTLLSDTELTDTQRDYVETIRISGDTLLTIINDILDFSKIEADRIDLEEAPFDLRAMIEEALDLLASKAYEKPLDLVYHIEEDVPQALIGDVTRLRQVIVNLIGNAIKFTEHGAILLTVSKRRTVGGDHELMFAVRDTGIGIPADRIDRLFSSFSQVDSSHTRKYGGTGLGLAISKRLAELMGGTMWVESEVGQGSTFSFTILVRASASVTRSALKGKQAPVAEKRILVMEDGTTSRTALVKQLRAWGLVVTAPPRGLDALRLLREGGRFDAALIDMQLGDMDSLTLARGLQDAYTTTGGEANTALPLIGLTTPGALVQTNGLFAAVLSKPLKQSTLYEALLRIFGAEPAGLADLPTVNEEGIWIQRNQETPTPEAVQLALRGAADETPLLPPLRILLAEDNAVNQKVALRILERLGYDADLAENGQEVLDALDRLAYDLVLMDVQMPVLDGIRATQQVRATLPPERQPRIVAMTANAMEGDRELCLSAGMDDYIAKPIRREALVEALMRCEPISALKLDAAPLGTSAAIPIQRSTELELPAFARNAPPPSDEVNRTVTDGLSLSAAPLPDLPEVGRKPSALPQSFSLSDPSPMATEMPEGFSAPPADPLQDPSTKRNPFRRPTAAPVIAAPPPAEPEDSADVSSPASVDGSGPQHPDTAPPEQADGVSVSGTPAPDSRYRAEIVPGDLAMDEAASGQPDVDTAALFPLPPTPSLTDADIPGSAFDSPAPPPAPSAPSSPFELQPPVPPTPPPPPTSDPFAFPSFEIPSFSQPSAPDPTSRAPQAFDAPPPVADEAARKDLYREDVDEPILPPSSEVNALLDDPGFTFPSFDTVEPQPLPEPTLDFSAFETAPSFPEPEAPPPRPPSDAHVLPSPQRVLQHLREISGVDDPDFAREVLEGYLRSDLSLIGSVVEGVRTRSYSEVRAATHKLKSSTATLGAPALAGRCADLERESRQERFEADAATRVAALQDHAFAFRGIIQDALRLLG